ALRCRRRARSPPRLSTSVHAQPSVRVAARPLTGAVAPSCVARTVASSARGPRPRKSLSRLMLLALPPPAPRARRTLRASAVERPALVYPASPAACSPVRQPPPPSARTRAPAAAYPAVPRVAPVEGDV